MERQRYGANTMSQQRMAAWIIGLLTAAMIIGGMAISRAAHAGDSWCSDWEDGYTAAYYLQCYSCQSIPPQVCPYPVETDDRDGYMRGVVDGAEAGTKAQEDYL